MTKQVIWTKLIVEEFVKEGCLTKEEEEVLRTRASGYTITQQAMKLNMSEAKVSKIIARLKVKYDEVAKYNPLLPPRKASAQETYMDNN